MMGLYLLGFLLSQTLFVFATSDSSAQKTETNERTGRSWHHPASAPQTLQQLQQNQPPVFLQTSTNQPGDSAAASDPSGGGRTFEEQDKSAIPAASNQDFLSRHYGYLNVHRFDPNFPYYDTHAYPRYPSPHSPRFGPGYRKDKYGHGYGYSCKHGDDCDEVRAANQIPLAPPPPPPPHHIPPHHAPHNIPPTPYNNPFVDISAFSNLPPYPGHPSFAPYSSGGGLYPPARYNDLHMPLPHQMPPRFYHGRYLHDQQQEDKKEKEIKKDDAKEE